MAAFVLDWLDWITDLVLASTWRPIPARRYVEQVSGSQRLVIFTVDAAPIRGYRADRPWCRWAASPPDLAA